MDPEEKVRKVLHEIGLLACEPSCSESIFESGLLDSFALTDLIAGIEKEFSLSIPDSDLIPRKFDSIDKIVNYLRSRGL